MRQHSANFIIAPPPQPNRRPRSWLLHFVAPAAAALWQFPPRKASVRCAHPRPRSRRFLPNLVGVILPGAFCPSPDHASLLLIICYCLGKASVLYSFACRRSHFAALRFTSSVYASVHPCPGNGERKNDAGTYRNPSPGPPPAVISGRGSRSNALELVPIVGIQPLLAALTTLTLSASVLQSPNQDGTSLAKTAARLRRVILPGAFCPGPDHASLLPFVGYCRGSSHRTRVSGTVAAGAAPVSHFQHHRQPIREYPVMSGVVRCASTARYAARPAG